MDGTWKSRGRVVLDCDSATHGECVLEESSQARDELRHQYPGERSFLTNLLMKHLKRTANVSLVGGFNIRLGRRLFLMSGRSLGMKIRLDP